VFGIKRDHAEIKAEHWASRLAGLKERRRDVKISVVNGKYWVWLNPMDESPYFVAESISELEEKLN